MNIATTDQSLSKVTSLQEGMIEAASARPWLYVEQIVCHLKDEVLDATILTKAWSFLMLQQPVLSTTFDFSRAGKPRQKMAVGRDVSIETLDWAQLPEVTQARQLQEFLSSDRARGCDLTASPCFRLTLIRTGEQSCKFIWTFPHALLDGRSFAPLLEQAFDNYELLQTGGQPEAKACTYSDVFWLHCQRLERMDHDAGIAYFGKVLNGWEGSNEILDAQASPARKETITVRVAQSTTEQLRSLACRSKVTNSALVSAAWGMVLARFSGRADAVFGTTRNGRHLVDQTGSAPGCFIVTTPLRVHLAQDMTLGALLSRIRQDQIELRPYEQTPLGRLRRVAEVPLDQPLLSSLLMFENGTLNAQMKALGGAWTRRQVDLHEEDDMPLTLAAYMDEALEVVAEYDPNRVPKAKQLLQYLDTLLQAFASASPETKLSDLNMLSAAENTMLEALSGSAATLPAPETCCVTSFEQVAAQQPKAVALRQVGGQDITFAELDQAANALAHDLVVRGIGCGDRVGICINRSPLFVLSILAIWKVGGAFVPMDPTYPQSLLEIMAEDSETKLILKSETSHTFSQNTLHLGPTALESTFAEAPDRTNMPHDRLAYVLFTSGTTGRPKGVSVSHASLGAHAQASASLFDLKSNDRALQFASLSFDVAIEEIVPTLLSGACLILRSDEMAGSISVFLDECEAEHISLLNLPTGYWVELVRHLEKTGRALPKSTRLMIVGGERVPLSALRRWRKLRPDLPWINGYGPTETTITCTAHVLEQLDADMTSVPIGKPLGHAVARVWAADGSLAPVGTEGELVISGLAVADGYVLSNGEKPQRFQHTSNGDPLKRRFQTGDRVFWQDGELQFLGRSDRQVKLRGYRIDLGQVETAMEELPEIERAHVAVPDFGNAKGNLVAWYSLGERAQASSAEDLRMALEEKLPKHMQPVLVHVSSWPKTAGGKTDLASLPEPETAASNEAEEGFAELPQTQMLIDFFMEVLETEAVQAGTSFFDAGGDSLSLLRLLSLVEKATGQALTSAQVYDRMTPAGLGQLLQENTPAPAQVVPLQSRGEGVPIYALHSLGENFSFYVPLSRALKKTHPFFAISIGLRAADFPKTVEKMGEYYADQINEYQPNGPIALVAVSVSSMIAFEVAQQLLRAGREVKGPFFFDAAGPAGRARKGRMACRWVHAKKFLKYGIPYAAKLLRERQFEARHEQTLVQLADADAANQGSQDENLSASEFVAATELAISDYSPLPYPQKLTIFRADDPFDDKSVYEEGLGWHQVASGGFEVIDVKGGHINMLHDPHVAGLADLLAEALAKKS